MAFNHENLKVYQRTLIFNSKVGIWTGQWDNKHAARLDLCVTQGLLPQSEVDAFKLLLARVSVMTSSLIKSIQR